MYSYCTIVRLTKFNFNHSCEVTDVSEAVKTIKYSYYKAKDLDFKPVAYDINNSKKVNNIFYLSAKKTVLKIAFQMIREDSFGYFGESVHYLRILAFMICIKIDN